MINFIKNKLQEFKKEQGNTPSINLVISLTSFNLLAFLKGQSIAENPIFPAIYWEDKEQLQTIACLGQIETCHHIPQPTEQASYFGGLAFQQQGPQWKDFPAIYFIRPALEFKLEKQIMTLTCHFNGKNSVENTLLLIQKFKKISRLSPINNNIISRQDTPNQQQWANMLDLAIEYKALIPKVVLSRETELLCQKRINHIDLLNLWKQANPSSFHFSLQFTKEHAYIGCSPERLFSRENLTLKTEALAGTINRGRNTKEDQFLLESLLTDKKIDRENYLVQEFIVSSLKQLKAEVNNEDAYVMQLHNVQHLCVPINANLNPKTTDNQLLYQLHPTPAVGGCPKAPALQFINDHEPYLRGWYAGTIGYLRQKKSDFTVAIRTALISENKIKLFAGAGIVTGSIAEQEWQELDNKIETILEIIKNG